MERKIGEIFEYNGEWYQCIPDITNDNCNNCFFQKSYSSITGNCSSAIRSDGKSVAFKKLEKVGEPYFNGQYGEVLQEYKYYIPPITPDLRIHIIKLGIVGIEIKQTKEDMEEDREYSEEEFKNNPRFQHHKNIEQVINMKKMKPFNLEQAKAGKPVCTRDGRKARIICFDAKGQHPIIALVTDGIQESPYNYTEKGCHYIEDVETMADLMMLPEKKSGWANIVIGSDGRPHMGRGIFQSKKAAEDAIKAFSSKLIDTVKVEWYE